MGMLFQGLINTLDMVQPLATGCIIDPALIYLMLRILYASQFFQKQLQVVFNNDKLLDVVLNRVTVFTDVIIYDKFPRAIVVGKTLRD